MKEQEKDRERRRESEREREKHGRVCLLNVLCAFRNGSGCVSVDTVSDAQQGRGWGGGVQSGVGGGCLLGDVGRLGLQVQATSKLSSASATQ